MEVSPKPSSRSIRLVRQSAGAKIVALEVVTFSLLHNPSTAKRSPSSDLNGLRAEGRVEAITSALGNQQHWVCRIGLHFLASAMNVRFQRVGGDRSVVTPDLLQECLTIHRVNT
jgi:hypothetical protein